MKKEITYDKVASMYDPHVLLEIGDAQVLDASLGDAFIKSATPWADLDKMLEDESIWTRLDEMLED